MRPPRSPLLAPLAVLAAVTVAATAKLSQAPDTATVPVSSPVGAVVPVRGSGADTSRPSYLPDPVLTPGAVDPAVTQASIHEPGNLCTPGYSATKRLPDDAKWRTEMRAICARYHTTYQPSVQEMDHLIPICLGGDPVSTLQLWPQPYAGPFGARVKDKVEVAALHAVCSDRMTLADAQAGISKDWVAMYRRLGLKPALP